MISGNRRGLGLALTEHLLRLGHEVYGFSSGSPAPNAVDASDSRAVHDWVERLVDRIGAPDLVVANAAVVTAPQPLWQVEPGDFSRVLDVNVKGMFYLFHAVVPGMLARGSGTLVGISSGYGRTTTPRMSPYCTSKWAVEGLMRTLAQELPKTMAAVALDPGTLQTDMLRTALGGGAKFFPTPDQWVARACELLLQLGPAHSGQSLSVPAT